MGIRSGRIDSKTWRTQFLGHLIAKHRFKGLQCLRGEHSIQRSMVANEDHVALSVGSDGADGKAGGCDERMMCVECALGS